MLQGWGCTGKSPERTDAKPESWRKKNQVVQGDSEKETWHSSWTPLEQHSSRLAHLAFSLVAPGSEFLLVLEAFICWGFLLGTMLSSELGPPSGAPKAYPPFSSGNQLSLSLRDFLVCMLNIPGLLSRSFCHDHPTPTHSALAMSAF